MGHWASYHGRDRLLKLFLQAGLDTSIVDKEGVYVWVGVISSINPH